MRADRMTTAAGQMGSVWRLAASQPGWPLRIALLTFLLVLALPIILLALVAILLASAVFAVLALAQRTTERLRGRGRGQGRGLLGRRDGRENVRVIQRRDP
ncbi:MAG: hypothetical protein ACYSTY_02910 [Planctomycetota bacterium]|jgi:cobalamin synthase